MPPPGLTCANPHKAPELALWISFSRHLASDHDGVIQFRSMVVSGWPRLGSRGHRTANASARPVPSVGRRVRVPRSDASPWRLSPCGVLPSRDGNSGRYHCVHFTTRVCPWRWCIADGTSRCRPEGQAARGMLIAGLERALERPIRTLAVYAATAIRPAVVACAC